MKGNFILVFNSEDNSLVLKNEFWVGREKEVIDYLEKRWRMKFGMVYLFHSFIKGNKEWKIE